MGKTHTQQSILAALAKITPDNGHAITPSSVVQGTGEPKKLVDRQIVICSGQGELLVHVVSLDMKTGQILCQSVANVLGVSAPQTSEKHISTIAAPTVPAKSEPKKSKETSDAPASS